MGSLTGAVASQRVTEAPKGTLRLDGNQSSSAIAEACLTVRLTSRTGTKVGNSDPAVPNGRAVAQRIKATLGPETSFQAGSAASGRTGECENGGV